MKKTLLLMLLVLTASTVFALPRDRQAMQQAAREAISQQRQMRHQAPSTMPLKVLRSTAELDIIGYENGGFAVVSADDLMPEVLGVSLSRYTGTANPNFTWWLEATRAAIRHAVQQNAPLQVTTPDPVKYPEEVPSMVTSKWYQSVPYNNMCPIWSGSTRCLTGCVATAMAQVLNYHQTPEHGQGERTIYYPQGNPTGQAVYANFEDDYYDWANMLDIYSAGSYSDEQANAVALLMRDCGVAADMQYGGPSEGSGAYSTDAAYGLRKYFGFEDAECLERDNYSEAAWMDIIYRELSENGPLYYGGASWIDGGHAFVLDGYNAQGQVSVNWGWAGDDDGMFYISQLNPSGYNFNMGQDMIIGVKSNKRSLLVSREVSLTEAGSLQRVLEESITEENVIIGTLTVEGPVNDVDLAYMRYLAGSDANGEPTDGRLRILDLTKAKLNSNLLPDSAFQNCTMLRRLRLPETIAAIGSKALAGCTGLMELRVTCNNVPVLNGNDVFLGMPLGTAKLYVKSGLKNKYLQAAQWRDFGEANIFQVGTSVKVRNAIRYYGESNPVFYYNVTGGKIEGDPSLTCDATPLSPAGRYPVHISAGTVVNSEAVNFIDGYLIIRKKEDVQARVVNAEREEGQPNPDFQLTYSGLINNELAPVWIQQPRFVTIANESSAPGEYTVTVADAEAESYEITFLPGRLTVTPAPVQSAISDVNDRMRTQAPAYNLQGQRVNGQQRGLFIVDGKKVVR